MTNVRARDRLNARRCRYCGCTDDRACGGGCSWVAADVCSECARKPRDVRTLMAALERRRRADDEIEAVLHERFPVGARLTFKGDGRGTLYAATVVMNCYGDRIKVRNEATGRERFIYAYRIV